MQTQTRRHTDDAHAHVHSHRQIYANVPCKSVSVKRNVQTLSSCLFAKSLRNVKQNDLMRVLLRNAKRISKVGSFFLEKRISISNSELSFNISFDEGMRLFRSRHVSYF